jgi:putative addiction module component (TIGR02574 family)
MIDLKEILELSNAEKILISEKIWDSINHNGYNIPDSHKKELDNRLAEIEKGNVTFSTWEEVKTKIDKLR